MPSETQQVINWVLTQTFLDEYDMENIITKDHFIQIVDKVREYFNANSIEYNGFSYNDLIPYLN